MTRHLASFLFLAAFLVACGGSGSSGGAAFTCPTVTKGSKYSALVVFGDSTVDSGYYRGIGGPPTPNPTWSGYWAAAVAAGAGVPTSSPGRVYPQVLAAALGLHADPANQPCGTNFATSGAKNVDVNTAVNGGFRAAVPTVMQIASYLGGGPPDPKALYLVSSGDNDVAFADGRSGTGPFPADPGQYVTDAANALAHAVAGLKAAGAIHLVVANLPSSFGSATTQPLRATYNTALFSTLTALGTVVIEADIDAVRLQIKADPAKYGFTSIGNAAGDTACVPPAGITSAWALLCSAAAGAPSTFASPTADQTLLFADDGHLATAGQKILADYVLGLVQ